MDIKNRFNQKYKDNPQSFGNKVMPILEKATEYVSHGDVLDLGVGNGRNSLYLLSKSYKITGVDLSEEGIKILRERSNNNPNLKLIVGDVTKFNSTKKFDIVLAIGLLHFLDIENIKKLIANMKKLTKTGGINVIATRMTQNLREDLPHIFRHNELKGFYDQDGWDILEYEEYNRGWAKLATIIAKKHEKTPFT